MLSKFDELKLIARCALGDDRHAFGMLVEAYQTDIRRFFLNLTFGDASLSDDLSQETFIKAYTSIRSFKGLSKFSTWLYRIAYNEFYSYTRKRQEERLDENNRSKSPDEPLGNYEETSNSRLDINTALQTLNETERSVVTLYYLQDIPIKKITEITDLPEGTIKSHLSRARTKMAQVLKR
ncbi:MAG: RNA polymerase sigma factor [Muribaculaceae bacterium]|nr:RNA polymerase sigma factor [Muribaculaceae bacterium]